MTPQETEPKPPANIGESPVEAMGMEALAAVLEGPLGISPLGGCHEFYHRLEGWVISGQELPEREHKPTNQQITALKLY